MSSVPAQSAWLAASAASQSSSLRDRYLLFAVAALLFFYGLSGSELWRTEALRARIAQEMLWSGDLVVPRLYGEPLFTKPPGMYLAIVLCSLPFGQVTEFSARLPSALAATASLLMFSWYVRRQLGRAAGVAAGLILPMSFLWLDKASAAEIDALQVFWILASIVCFLRATEDETRPGPFGWWLAALLCVAAGVLTKWTAPEFFYGTAIPFLWWRGRWRVLLSWQHLVSAGIAAALCLAWVTAAVWIEGWQAFWPTVEREAASRLVPGYSERAYPFAGVLLHPLRLLCATLPWSPLALLTLLPGFQNLWDERGRRLLQAFHCWTWPQVLFWSLITEHTPRHSFPLFPGVAGLATMAWLAWHQGWLRLPWAPARNPKSEIRSPKQTRNSNDQNQGGEENCVAFRILNFGFVSDFGFRISDFCAKRLARITARGTLAWALVAWVGLKIAFVHGVMPARNAQRDPRAKGALLASLVPRDAILYLLRLKDEGILFYYARPAQRLASAAQLPKTSEPLYCALWQSEWAAWPDTERAEVVQELRDEQGEPMVLIRVAPP